MRETERAQPRPPCPHGIVGWGVVGFEGIAEDGAGVSREQVPGDDEIDCGVADGEAPEVDHGADLAIAEEEVTGVDVAVQPGGRCIPAGGAEGGLLLGAGGGGIDAIAEGGDGFADHGISLDEGDAAAEVVLAGRRSAGQVDAAQCDDKLGQGGGGKTLIGDALEREMFAGEPGIDRPVPGVALRGRAQPERERDGEREERADLGQPALLLVDLLGGGKGAGQAQAHVVAEAEEGVADAGGGDGGEREAGPVGELRREQAADEGDVGDDFVGVRAGTGH